MSAVTGRGKGVFGRTALQSPDEKSENEHLGICAEGLLSFHIYPGSDLDNRQGQKRGEVLLEEPGGPLKEEASPLPICSCICKIPVSQHCSTT